MRVLLLIGLGASLLDVTGCSKAPTDSAPAASVAPQRHEHHPPHGGTPVVLGAEAYHLELVRDAAAGTLQVYVLDGEMDEFVRVKEPSMVIDMMVNTVSQALELHAIANAATGETIGDTALFEGQAEWLRTAGDFDATLRSITIRGTIFSGVKFNFPRGNDQP